MARMRAVHNGFVIRPCTTSSTCSLIELPKSDTSQSNGTMGFVMIDRNPFWSGENVFLGYTPRRFNRNARTRRGYSRNTDMVSSVEQS